jgi:hypothetical protein
MICLTSFSIMHGPTTAERTLMEDWIEQFVAFVKDNHGYEFGTRAIDEIKVATPDGTIEIQKGSTLGESGQIRRCLCK